MGGPPEALGTPPGAPGCQRVLEKIAKIHKKIYKKFTCTKIAQIKTLTPTLGHFGYPGGASRGQKVILLGQGLFLLESTWSFRQNVL